MRRWGLLGLALLALLPVASTFLVRDVWAQGEAAASLLPARPWGWM